MDLEIGVVMTIIVVVTHVAAAVTGRNVTIEDIIVIIAVTHVVAVILAMMIAVITLLVIAHA